MLDPRQTFIDVTVRIGRDVTLYPGTMLQGSTVVGDECEVGPDTRLVDCSVGDGATVDPHRRRRCRGRAGRRRRTVCPSPCGFVGPRGHEDRGVLHCTHRVTPRQSIGPQSIRGDSQTHGKGHHQTARALLGPDASANSPTKSRRTSTSNSATTTSSSSPTARSAAGSVNRSAAPTCSSSRVTTASTTAP